MGSIRKGVESIQAVKELARDPVAALMSDFLATGNLPFEDVCYLKNLATMGSSLFNADEIMWFVNHHHFWSHLIKSPKGNRIFLELYRMNNNSFRVSSILKVNRRTVTKWAERLLTHWLLFIDTEIIGNERFLVMNKGKYPKLLLLTRWMILEFNSGQHHTQ